jgi:hypothetical protein
MQKENLMPHDEYVKSLEELVKGRTENLRTAYHVMAEVGAELKRLGERLLAFSVEQK